MERKRRHPSLQRGVSRLSGARVTRDDRPANTIRCACWAICCTLANAFPSGAQLDHSVRTLPEMLAAGLKRPFHIALSYDEEVGCIGVGRLIEDLARARVQRLGGVGVMPHILATIARWLGCVLRYEPPG